MSHGWNTTNLDTIDRVLQVLLELKGKNWICRGQNIPFGKLVPSIDRKKLHGLQRAKKLQLERESINLFRSTAHYFASTGEQGAIYDDFIALMVMRHYGIPTRLLDWSSSPYVAAYFAICDKDESDGEIWAFDYYKYTNEGKKQWREHPETTEDYSGDHDKFSAGMTAFDVNPPNWFITAFYPSGFPRQNSQSGAYTMTAHFDCDHADAIMKLLQDKSHHHLYKIPAKLMPKLRGILREQHGIWLGSLFPDSAGAAKVINLLFSDYSTA